MATSPLPFPVPESPYGEPTSGGTPVTTRLGLLRASDSLSEEDKAALRLEGAEDQLESTIEELKPIEMDYLASKVQGEFAIAKGARILQEQAWLRCHLNLKGKYPSDMDFGASTSRAFVQVTRPKVQTSVAMLLPIIMPPGYDSWTIDPTPRPSMPGVVQNLLAQGATPEMIFQAVKQAAEKAADSLSKKVRDGFAETNWPSKLARTLLDFALYGTSIIMGPLAVPSCAKKKGEEPIHGLLELEALGFEDEYRPELEVISPFDFYPDPGGRTIEECTHAIVRKVLNRSQLRDLRVQPGFMKDAIDSVLQEIGDGNWTPEYWESTVNISNDQTQMTAPNGRFICLVRWGYLSGRDLRSANIDVPDEQLEDQVMAQVWVINNKVISLRVSELHRNRLPFYVTPFAIVPHTIWGMGVAEMMWDAQDAINACERAKMDNMALVCRPQMYVTVDRLMQGSNVLEQRAGKIWGVRESEISSGKPIEWQIPTVALNEIRAIQQDTTQLAQEQTAMPNLLMGMGGEGIHNRTSSGASMQFNAAITPLKSVVFNLENYMMVPLVSKMADFYQTYSEDPTIKGDYKVIAKGVQGLMAREALMNMLTNVIQITSQNPGWSERTNMSRVYELVGRYSGLTDCDLELPDEVVQQRRQEQAQMEQQSQMQKIAAQTEANIKQRAQTAPIDILLEALKAAPDGSALKVKLIDETLKVAGLLSPEIDAAVNNELAVAHYETVNRAYEAGMSQTMREKDYERADAEIRKLDSEAERNKKQPGDTGSKRANKKRD